MTALSSRRSTQARGFLFADLRGYTAFVEARGDSAAAELLRTYRATVRRVIAQFDGAEIRTEGDSFYVVFPSASDAVLAGLAILEEAASSPAATPLRVGIGVHAGETTETDEGYVGWAVNIAARVCAAAGPGELFVTDTVRALTRGQLAFRFEARGRRRLKGIAEPVAVYAVTSAEAPIPPRRSRAAGLRNLRRPVDRLALPLALAVGVLVLTAGAIALIGPSLGGLAQVASTSTPAVSPSPGGESEPAAAESDAAGSRDAADQQLLGRIDPGIARHCASAPLDEAPGIGLGPPNPADPNELVAPLATDAGLRCSLGGGAAPDVVEYWQAVAATNPFDEAFFRLAADRNVPDGDCAETTRALGTWELGASGGRLLCTAFGGQAFIAWSYDGEYIMALATRDDGDIDALLSWWENTQRLLSPEAAASDSREIAEQRLLDRIDPDVARHCSGADAEEAPRVVPRLGYRIDPAAPSDRVPVDTAGGLICNLGGGASPDEVQYWQVQSVAWVEDAFFLLASDRNVPPGNCEAEPSGEGTWEFGVNGGRLLCTAFGGEALVAWTYDGETILGLATRSDGDIQRLLEWWNSTARTIGP